MYVPVEDKYKRRYVVKVWSPTGLRYRLDRQCFELIHDNFVCVPEITVGLLTSTFDAAERDGTLSIFRRQKLPPHFKVDEETGETIFSNVHIAVVMNYDDNRQLICIQHGHLAPSAEKSILRVLVIDVITGECIVDHDMADCRFKFCGSKEVALLNHRLHLFTQTVSRDYVVLSLDLATNTVELTASAYSINDIWGGRMLDSDGITMLCLGYVPGTAGMSLIRFNSETSEFTEICRLCKNDKRYSPSGCAHLNDQLYFCLLPRDTIGQTLHAPHSGLHCLDIKSLVTEEICPFDPLENICGAVTMTALNPNTLVGISNGIWGEYQPTLFTVNLRSKTVRVVRRFPCGNGPSGLTRINDDEVLFLLGGMNAAVTIYAISTDTTRAFGSTAWLRFGRPSIMRIEDHSLLVMCDRNQNKQYGNVIQIGVPTGDCRELINVEDYL